MEQMSRKHYKTSLETSSIESPCMCATARLSEVESINQLNSAQGVERLHSGDYESGLWIYT